MAKKASDRAPTILQNYNPNSRNLEKRATQDFVHVFFREEERSLSALQDPQVERALARAIDQSIARIRDGGRIFYVAAGTPARLAYADVSECLVTFNIPEGIMIPIIAGGVGALMRPIEGAEDNEDASRAALKEREMRACDVLCGISASGTTPFVRSALTYAREEIGCLSICIVCAKGLKNNDGSPLADIVIEIDTGPEIIYGSTRLKAGTAQKIILNAYSTGIWRGLGKTYDGLMTDVPAHNVKLKDRRVMQLSALTRLSHEDAAHLLASAHGNFKTAVVMHMKNMPREDAEKLFPPLAYRGLRDEIGDIHW